MSDRIYSKEFINWTKGTVGLQITKEGLCEFVKHEMEEFINELQSHSNDDHFTRFLESLINKNQTFCRYATTKEIKEQRSGAKWVYVSSCNFKWCIVCKIMFDKVLDKHARKRSRNIDWKCHDSLKTITPLIRWWVVAKIYIPDNNEKIKNSTGPAEVDVLSLLSLLVHCEVFKNIKHIALDVIEERNKLMHSATGQISETDMTDAFYKMKALLGEKDVKKTSHKQLRDLKKLEQMDMYLLKTEDDDHEMIRKALKMKKKAIKYDINENKKDDIPTTELEELLEKTDQAITIEKEHRKQDYISKKEEIRKQKEEIQTKNEEMQKMTEEIQKKNEEVNEKNEEIQKKDDTIQKKTEEIQNKDETIQEKTEEIQKKDKTIQEKTEEIQKKDKTIQKDIEEIQKKNEEVHKKNEEIQKRKEEVHEKTEEIQKKDNTIQEKTEEIQKKEETIQEKIEEIQKKNEEVHKRDEEIQKIKEEVHQKTGEIQKIKEEVHEKNKEIRKKDKTIQEKTEEIQTKDKTIQEKTEEIQKMDKTIQEKIEEIQKNTDEIQKKDKTIQEMTEEIQKNDETTQEKIEEIQRQFKTPDSEQNKSLEKKQHRKEDYISKKEEKRKQKEEIQKKNREILTQYLTKLISDMKKPVESLKHLYDMEREMVQMFIYKDDLYPEDKNKPQLYEMQGRSVAKLLQDAVKSVHYSADEEDIESVSLERVKGLIIECVPAALALVKDVDENKEREKLKIELVMKLLYIDETADQTCSFLYGICCVIAKFLSEKENEYQGFTQPCDWMIEAASYDKVIEAGSFRRSCLKILQSKVSPVLAGVIAILDTNQNIDICKDDTSAWKKELWLKVLNTPDVLDVKSPTRKSELQEAMVVYTGIGEKVFQSKMPFSWMIMARISDVLLATKTASLEDFNVICLLKEIPLCKLLLEITDEESIEEGSIDYLADFVCSVYNNGSHNENRVVSEALHKKALSLYKLFDEDSLLSAIICVHLAYDDMSNGLTYFRLMNSVWTECSSQILALQAKTPELNVLKADDIVLTAAFLLCQNVSPVKLDGSSNRSLSKIERTNKRIEWLRNLQQYRPVLEQTLCYLGLQENSSEIFTNETIRVKCNWERIMVMKMFVEHICLTREEKTYVKLCMPLWIKLKKLGENVSMKMIEPINELVNFMKLINQKHVKKLLGDAAKCSQCERKQEEVPVKLPCGDLVCRCCFERLRTRDRKCFTCRTVFDVNWEPTKENQNFKEKEIVLLKEYQKKCNAFFMDMISQLCFSENSAPSDKVIKQLLSFITYDGTMESTVLQTKVMSIFDTCIDPNPVFRSFLLQQLMKTSMKDVRQNLDYYLKDAGDIIKQQTAELDQNGTEKKDEFINTRQYIELCLMVIQCLEDAFLQEANSAEDEVKYAADALGCVSDTLDKEELSVNKLVCLAKARMGLTICAKYLNAAFEKTRKLPTNVAYLLEAAKSICKDNFKCKWPRIYVVKTITRCNGLGQYYRLCSSEDKLFNWVYLPEAQTGNEHTVSDRYIVCGEDYLRVRKAVTEVALGGDTKELDTVLQELGSKKISTAVFLDLAVHREITCSYIFPLGRRPVPDTSIAVFRKFISERLEQRYSDMSLALQNALLPEELKVVECLDIHTQGMQCLIVHYMTVMRKLEGNRKLLQPLTSLITNAYSCKEGFLPTMPQDDTAEFRDLLLKDSDVKDTYFKPTTLYKCPNGHIYLVTNSRNPMVTTNCMDCGAKIGRSGNHEAFGSNKLDDNIDETKPGHILGQPENRSNNALPERQLTPTFCACVRLLLHMSLYLGAANNLDAICNIIQDDIKKENVSMFLWKHMKVDIENLENALGKSIDDVLLCMHVAIDNLMKIHVQGERLTAAEDVRMLSSKVARKEWEIKFTKTYLQDTFNNLEDVLKSSNGKIAEDNRLGGNPLLCLMHETQSVSEGTENPQMLQEVSRVWRFRTPISLEHLRNDFKSAANVDEEQWKVLRIFLKEECHLRALRFVPNIQRLQRALLKTYHRKLDRNEGNTINIQKIIDGKIAGPDTQTLIKNFKEAWELVRMSLKTYVCQTEIGGVVVPEKLCDMSITNDTPVSILLPATKGMGLCSYALLDFLMRRVHNGFLDNFLKETQRSNSSFLSVKPKELTSAHLISFDPQQDLLPLILANCQYTFKMGKGTTIQYDFNGLENQVIDRFLLSKSRIDVGPILQIDMMVYRTEVTNTAVFKKLAEKIPQVPLSHAVKTQVSGEIRAYPDLCESLVNMDIAISFLKSTGGKPEQSLHAYMTDVLRMNTSISSRTAQQSCQLQHCKKMWLHLTFLKSKMMADNNKATASIFEGVRQTYHEKMQQETIESLDPFLRGLTIEKLAPFVEVLHEYIVLYVTVEENADNIAKQRLQDHLPVYIDLLYKEEDTDGITNTVDELSDVLNSQCLPLWMMAYNILREKQTGDRRF